MFTHLTKEVTIPVSASRLLGWEAENLIENPWATLNSIYDYVNDSKMSKW